MSSQTAGRRASRRRQHQKRVKNGTPEPGSIQSRLGSPADLNSPSSTSQDDESPELKHALTSKAAKLAAREAARIKKEEKARDRKLHGYDVQRNGLQMLSLGKKLLKNRDFIFISLDLEMWELDTLLITEIGVSILDMTDQQDYFMPSIQTYHIVPREVLRRRNGRRIADKREYFTQGKTMVMPHDKCREFWGSLVDGLKAKSQNVFFVGQSVKDDLYCLSKNNYQFDRSIPVLDTQLIWEATCNLPSSLGKILTHLRVPHCFLHNAGNDAYFTLRALIMMLDDNVRYKYELDIGPSKAEADRIAQEHRKKKSDDPDELNLILSPEQQALKDEEERMSKLSHEERQKEAKIKKIEREKRRLEETKQDMPGKFIYMELDEVENLIDSFNI